MQDQTNNNNPSLCKELIENMSEVELAKTALGLTEKALDVSRKTNELVFAEGHLDGLIHAEQILNQSNGIKEAKKMLRFIMEQVTNNINKAYGSTQQQGENDENSNDQSSSDTESSSGDIGGFEGATVHSIGEKRCEGSAETSSELQSHGD